jgi:DNA-binding response OmpR family regulator
MTIVLLDSETRSQQFLKSILAHEIYDIDSASSEQEFLMKIRNREYDLYVVDLMSFESGVSEAMGIIREMSKEAPVITIATSGDQVSQDELGQIGNHVRFTKPLEADVFRAEVDMLLHKRKISVEAEEAQEGQEEVQTQQEEVQTQKEEVQTQKEEAQEEADDPGDQGSDEQNDEQKNNEQKDDQEEKG